MCPKALLFADHAAHDCRNGDYHGQRQHRDGRRRHGRIFSGTFPFGRGRAKDIAAIFLAMTAGLACAAGYIAIALLFTVLVCAVLVLLARIPFGGSRMMELHITVPESLRFAHAFDDLFETYTRRSRLVKTKTSNMGSLYKLLYYVELKNPEQAQELIDQLQLPECIWKSRWPN